jgi:hypothetical protein
LLTRQEKQELVIDLYKQEKTIREIAKEVRMSFSDIGAIIKKEFGSNEDDKNKEAQVLQLFSKGLKPIDVIMKLKCKIDEVKQLYTEYQSLCGFGRMNDMYEELGVDTELFFRLYKMMKEQGLGPEQILNAVKYGNDLPMLELKYEGLKERVKRVEDKRQNLSSDRENLESAISVSRTVITNLDQVIEQKTREVESLNCQKKKIGSNILYLMGSKEYKRVNDVARQEVETTLKDKRALLLVTLVAVIEALKLDPEKQMLLSDKLDGGGSNPYFLEHQRKELLELAEQIQIRLANDIIKMAVNSPFDIHL